MSISGHVIIYGHNQTKRPPLTEVIYDCTLVAELASKWNQVKRELITMWEIVNDVRKEVSVGI